MSISWEQGSNYSIRWEAATPVRVYWETALVWGTEAAATAEPFSVSANFIGTNGQTLNQHNPKWVSNGAANLLLIYNNAVRPNLLVDAAYLWDDASWTPDQRSTIRVETLTANGLYLGVAVRGSKTERTAYLLSIDAGHAILQKIIKGITSDLSAQLSVTWPVTPFDLTLEVQGATLRSLVNGSPISGLGAVSDSGIAAGIPGISGWGNGTANYFTSWVASNVESVSEPASPTPIPPPSLV